MDDVLRTIEGRSGEVLACAVLKILLIQSSRMRRGVAELLRPNLGREHSLSFRDGIECQVECPTECRAENNGVNRGRIDLLLRDPTSGLTFGIEAKFGAPFSPDQPGKYWDTLTEKAGAKRERVRIVLLVPEARTAEARRHVEERSGDWKESVVYLSWEEIRGEAEKIKGGGEELGLWAQYFVDFVNDNVVPQLLPEKAQLVGAVQMDNLYHRDFLQIAKTILPQPGHITAGREHVGVSFQAMESANEPGDKSPPNQWLGFLRASDAEPVCLCMWFGWGVGDQRVKEAIELVRKALPNPSAIGMELSPFQKWNGCAVDVQVPADRMARATLENHLRPFLEIARNVAELVARHA